jgi:cell division septation protein DedD
MEGAAERPAGGPASASARSPEVAGLPISEVTAAAAVPEPGPSALAPAPDVAAAPPSAPPERAALDPETALSGAYAVQLASLQDREQALAFLEDLQARHPDLLGSFSAAIRRADLGERGVFHRVRVGPFADLDGARSLCAALGSRGLDCLVVQN